jgi:D-psicose/D-tagatose/L-ribulose 3-epimerase
MRAMTRAALLALVLLPLEAHAAKGLPIGCFVHVTGREVEEAKAAGFDFLEVGLRDVVALPAAELEALLRRAGGIRIVAAINFLPPDLKVVGPQIDVAAQNAYLARAFTLAERVGIGTVVFGSGKSRSFPAGFAREEALRQLAEFGRRAATEARKHHVTIALEPLGTDETNTVNSVREAVDLARAVGNPSFGVAIDYYHLTLAHEDPAAVVEARDRLQHVRIANPAGRAFPLAAGESNYAAFFAVLRKIGYRGAIGIEARTGSVSSEGPRSLAFLRKMTVKLVSNSQTP